MRHKELVLDSLLYVMWMIDPACYTFYYITAGKIRLFHPPPRDYEQRIPRERRAGGTPPWDPSPCRWDPPWGPSSCRWDPTTRPLAVQVGPHHGKVLKVKKLMVGTRVPPRAPATCCPPA